MSNKRPKKRSPVWEHFEQTPDGERAICKHCSSSLGGKSTSGTTHLKRHIEICSRDRDPAPRNKVRKFGFTDDKSWEVEVKRAVLAEIPFASSDCKKVFCSLNCPMEMDIEKSIYAYYEREKEKLVTEFENLTSRVSFTTDIMEEAGYFSITAHFINDDFNLVHKLIGFRKIPSQTSIASAIQSCISDWRLGEKIFMLTHGEDYFDICSALNAGFRFSQTCRKELIVSLISNVLFYLFSLEHVKIVRFIDSVATTNRILDELNQISKDQGLPPINVGLFMGMNLRKAYSSIVRVIECTFLYREVFRQYAPREGGLMCLSEINWERVELLLNTCKLLGNETNGLLSFKNPSLHLLIPYLLKIKDNTSNTEIGSISSIVQSGGRYNHMNFEEALLNTIIRSHKIYYITCVLDPRCKLYPFEYIEEIDQLEITKGIREKVHGGLEELFGEYAKEENNHTSPLQIGITGTTNTQHEVSSINSAHPGHVQNASGFSMYMLRKQKMKPKTSELDEYLNEKVTEGTDGNFDLLGWWKENKSRYPILSRMARDILAIPATVYKVNEHITSDRWRLEEVNPQLVEAVVCSKDWIISSSQSPTLAERVKGEHARRQKAGSLKKEPYANPYFVWKRGNKLNSIELATLEYIRQNIKSEEVIVHMYAHASASVIEENCLLKERTLTVEKMACLLKPDNSNGSWLSDEIMNCYIRVIKHGRDEKRKVIIQDTLDYQWLIGRGKEKHKVHESNNKTWNRILSSGQLYHQNEMVIMPVNPSGKHWYVIAINFRKKEFQILDSLRSMNNYDEYKVAASNLGTGIQVCVDASINQPEKMHSQWKKSSEIVKWPVIIASVPPQEDQVSCGVFALKYIQFWNGEELEQGFYDADIDYHRKRMANEIIFSVLNKEKSVQDSIIQLSKES